MAAQNHVKILLVATENKEFPLFDVAATRLKNCYQKIGTRQPVLKKFVRRAQKSGGQPGRVIVQVRTGTAPQRKPVILFLSQDGCYIHKCHPKSTLSYSNMPTLQMIYNTYSFVTNIASYNIIITGTQVIVKNNICMNET